LQTVERAIGRRVGGYDENVASTDSFAEPELTPRHDDRGAGDSRNVYANSA